MSRRPFIDSLLGSLAGLHARRQYDAFLRGSEKAARVQSLALKKLIRRGLESNFGRSHGFAEIRNYDDFARQVPIQSYEDLRPYIERVMKGETTALFDQRDSVLMFAMTSGTVDKPKYIPVTPAFLAEYRRGWNIFGFKMFLDHADAWLRKILPINSPAQHELTVLGVPCGAISGLLTATQKRIVRRYYAGSQAVTQIGDSDTRYYTLLRTTIAEDVGWIVTASPASLLQLAKTAARFSESLIRDIHDGTLSPPGAVSPDIRESLGSRLSPNVKLAQQLGAMARRAGELRPADFWQPNLLSHWTGGAMRLHTSELGRYFGEIPSRDLGLLATEGRMSIPIEDGTPGGLLDYSGMFFEFIEDRDGTSDAAPVRCHEVTPGKEYRILLSNSAGLYRYDIGDIVGIRGFQGQAPVIEFLHRGAGVSSITGEKLTESQVVAAYARMDGQVSSKSYFLVQPIWADPPYYRLQIDGPVDDPAGLASAFDSCLQGINFEYGAKRTSGRLRPIVVECLPAGTLEHHHRKRRDQRGTAHEQYKPRYLLNEVVNAASSSD